ncbi:MAG: hypothetical protein JST96_18220, partial [Bacteroidetes bacterium]|nr:hypothetical protein [Bacteroidota bacterium]
SFRAEPINAATEPIVLNGVAAYPEQAITFAGKVNTDAHAPVTVKGYPVKGKGKSGTTTEAKEAITFAGKVSADVNSPITIKGYPVKTTDNLAVPVEPERTITFKGNANMEAMQPIAIKGYPLKLADNNAFTSWPLTNIIDDLAEQGVITDKENVELKLDDGVLIVNGVQQSEELHATMKNKYLKTEKSHIIYSRHGYSMSGDIKN